MVNYTIYSYTKRMSQIIDIIPAERRWIERLSHLLAEEDLGDVIEDVTVRNHLQMANGGLCKSAWSMMAQTLDRASKSLAN